MARIWRSFPTRVHPLRPATPTAVRIRAPQIRLLQSRRPLNRQTYNRLHIVEVIELTGISCVHIHDYCVTDVTLNSDDATDLLISEYDLTNLTMSEEVC